MAMSEPLRDLRLSSPTSSNISPDDGVSLSADDDDDTEYETRDEFYENRSSRKIDSWRLFSRE